MDFFLDAKLASSDPPALEDLEHAMAAGAPASLDAAPGDASRVKAHVVHSQLSGRADAGAHARPARPRRPLHEHDDPAAIFARRTSSSEPGHRKLPEKATLRGRLNPPEAIVCT